jgi:transcriptional regulator with XRE-family HTH domain
MAVAEERMRRRWSARELAVKARVSAATVTNVEAGRVASLDTYARLAVALGLELRLGLASRQRRSTHEHADLVHSAMGELEARWLAGRDREVALDHPYQHYQFAGRADVLAWTLDPPALLHIENRTRFPDLQSAVGSYNAKRQYLGRVLAEQVGLRRFESKTHVMVGLWSAEVIHSVRLRGATLRALCPDPADAFEAWLHSAPPATGRSSAFVLLDPVASSWQVPMISLERVLRGVRPRLRDYREAAVRLPR